MIEKEDFQFSSCEGVGKIYTSYYSEGCSSQATECNFCHGTGLNEDARAGLLLIQELKVRDMQIKATDITLE